MSLDILKKYPELLEILFLDPVNRINVLKSIYIRDIQDNPYFRFRGKQIYPIKSDGQIDMDREFTHLTCEAIEEFDSEGRKYSKRVFEKDRSSRLHWIRFHIEERLPDNIFVFSVEERDEKKRENVVRTYIYDNVEKYIIVLEPQRNLTSYYLLTAYYLNKPYAEKQIKKKMNKKLDSIV